MNLRLYTQLFNIEIKKLLTYRVDFWANFLGYLLVEVGCGYAVWKAVFHARGIDSLNGYAITDMITYYVLASLVIHSVRGKSIHMISRDIYEGSINKYLVYPVSFLSYKFIEQFSVCCIGILQGAAALFVYWLISDVFPLTSVNHMMIVGSTWILGVVIFFLMLCAIELWAFWVDNIWSMSVMFLKGFAVLFGGALFPVVMFGDYHDFVKALPFYNMYGRVIEYSMSPPTLDAWAHGLGVQSAWILVLGLCVALLWHRGKLQYTGIGI